MRGVFKPRWTDDKEQLREEMGNDHSRRRGAKGTRQGLKGRRRKVRAL